MTAPFTYPSSPSRRRHGPQGYASHSSFLPWLRDEFAFRCVYCLIREAWYPASFHIDHFLPTVDNPELELVYTNLVYACASCNARKQALLLPDPTKAMLEPNIRVLSDGALEPLTSEARLLVRRLGLNNRRYCDFRKLWIGIVTLAQQAEPELFRRLMAYPDDLPDLATLRPPGGNTRPEGITESHFERRKRGDLPDIY